MSEAVDEEEKEAEEFDAKIKYDSDGEEKDEYEEEEDKLHKTYAIPAGMSVRIGKGVSAEMAGSLLGIDSEVILNPEPFPDLVMGRETSQGSQQ